MKANIVDVNRPEFFLVRDILTVLEDYPSLNLLEHIKDGKESLGVPEGQNWTERRPISGDVNDCCSRIERLTRSYSYKTTQHGQETRKALLPLLLTAQNVCSTAQDDPFDRSMVRVSRGLIKVLRGVAHKASRFLS